MEINIMNANERLEKWLQENHPDVLIDAKEYIKDRPNWDLMDGFDAVASDIYGYWCELN